MTIYKNVLNHVKTKDGIKSISENVNDILARKDNRYKGWKCWAGISSLCITPNGDIYIASCKNKKIGNIYKDEKITLEEEPHVCTKEWCVCAADLSTRKVKDQKYIKYLRNITEEKND